MQNEQVKKLYQEQMDEEDDDNNNINDKNFKEYAYLKQIED